MVLARYLFKRYFVYLCSISLVLTLLFNVIEFFEKLVRVSHTSVPTILHFIALNFVPAFSDLLPITAWIAACLVIREFEFQGEWQTLFLLGVGYKKLVGLFFAIGMCVLIGGSLFHEMVSLPLSSRMEQFKIKHFKKGSPNKIFSKWYQLDDRHFCYFDMLDWHNKHGKNLLLIQLSSEFELQEIIQAQHFQLKPCRKELALFSGVVTGIDEEVFEKKIVTMPSFFIQVPQSLQIPSLTSLMQKTFLFARVMSYDMHRELVFTTLKRVFFYLQMLIYPLLSFLLFFVVYGRGYYKWLLIITPYPVIMFLEILIGFLFQNGLPVSTLLVPLVLFMLGVGLLAWKMCLKKG